MTDFLRRLPAALAAEAPDRDPATSEPDQPFHYADCDGDALHITALPDASKDNGDTRPVIALRVDNRDQQAATAYVELADVETVIAAIRAAAQDAGHAAGVDCQVPACGPCSFDRAVARTQTGGAR